MKKFGIILAILLCVALLFTFVACNGGSEETTPNNPDKTNPENNKTQDQDTGTLPGVESALISEMYTSIDAFLDAWMLANAQEDVKDLSSLLDSALNKVKEESFTFTDDELNDITPIIQVQFIEAQNQYKVVFKWAKGALSKTYIKNAVKVEYGDRWAGKMNKTDGYDPMLEEGETLSAVDKIVNAAFVTVNKVGTQAQTAKFGVDGKVGIEVMGLDYNLHIKGNIDLKTRKDTELALMIENTKGVLGGLYYIGAEKDEDCKIILQTGSDYKYLNYAIVNDLLSKVLTPKNEAGKDFLEGGTLAEILTKNFEVDSTVMSIINGVIDMVAQGYVKTTNNGTTYLVDINLSTVLTQLSQLGHDLIPEGALDGIPVLEDLDIATMHGLLGHITIAANVKGDKKDELVDFELAVNIPKCDFYFNGNKDTKPVEIPAIGFSVYLNDFSFLTQGKVENVIPAAAEEAKYFSPTNIDLGGDIYIKNDTLDDTFRFHLVTDANPFKPSQAKGSLTILQSEGDSFDAQKASNFLTVTYEQKTKRFCVSGTAFDMKDDGKTIYTFDFKSTDDAIATLKRWIGYDDVELTKDGLKLIEGKEGSDAAKAVVQSKIATAITKYYANKYKKADTANAESDGSVGSTAGGSEGFDFGKLGSYFTSIKGLYEELSKEGVIKIDTDKIAGSVEVTPATINKVTAFLNTVFGLQLPTDIKDPEYANVYFDTAEYEDKFYANVKFDGDEYKFTVDWGMADKVLVSFEMKTGESIYTVVADANTKEGSFTVSYRETNLKGEGADAKSVKFSNFFLNWGTDNTNVVEMPTELEVEEATPIFQDNGVATKLVTRLLNLLDGKSIEPYAEKVGCWIVDIIFG